MAKYFIPKPSLYLSCPTAPALIFGGQVDIDYVPLDQTAGIEVPPLTSLDIELYPAELLGQLRLSRLGQVPVAVRLPVS